MCELLFVKLYNSSFDAIPLSECQVFILFYFIFCVHLGERIIFCQQNSDSSCSSFLNDTNRISTQIQVFPVCFVLLYFSFFYTFPASTSVRQSWVRTSWRCPRQASSWRAAARVETWEGRCTSSRTLSFTVREKPFLAVCSASPSSSCKC